MKDAFIWTTEYPPAERAILATVEHNISRAFPDDYPAGFTFPHDYVACVLNYQGGEPSRRRLIIPNYGTILFDRLLTFILGDDYDILDQYNAVRKKMHTNLLFPFAWDSVLNYFCFDYRTEQDRPAVVFLPQDRTPRETFFISESFSTFLDKLE